MVLFPKTTGNYDSWDRFGRTVKQKWTKYNTSNVRDEINYTYDYAGNRTSREDVLAATNSVEIDQTYAYDKLHRLKSFKEGDLVAGTITTVEKEKNWTLDPLGNWSNFVEKDAGTTTLNQTRTHNDANELGAITASTGTNWADGACDAAGNMKTIPKPNDLANGFTATYDAWNRLVKIVDGATTVAEYEYDGLNQRIQKIVGADTYDYHYNMKWQAVVEFKNSVANRMNLHRSEYIDSLAVSVTATDRHYYLCDANFNVTCAITPSAGVAERYSYSPYGKVTVRDADFSPDADGNSDIGNEFLFTGRRLDAETGLYQFRNRYYSAEMGRFVNRDPIGYNGSKWNLYGAYFVPGGVDPSGLHDNNIPPRPPQPPAPVNGRIRDVGCISSHKNFRASDPLAGTFQYIVSARVDASRTSCSFEKGKPVNKDSGGDYSVFVFVYVQRLRNGVIEVGDRDLRVEIDDLHTQLQGMPDLQNNEPDVGTFDPDSGWFGGGLFGAFADSNTKCTVTLRVKKQRDPQSGFLFYTLRYRADCYSPCKCDKCQKATGNLDINLLGFTRSINWSINPGFPKDGERCRQNGCSAKIRIE